MENKQRKPSLGTGYFLPRDFEMVQPLYDLAFLLELFAVLPEVKEQQYRVQSLYKAAHQLDSYSSSVCMWLDDESVRNEQDYVPSNRIKRYLKDIRSKGSLQELSEFHLEHENVDVALKLRTIRGLSIKRFAFILKKAELSQQDMNFLATHSGKEIQDIDSTIRGDNYGAWQAAHVIPPLMRFLSAFQPAGTGKCKFEIDRIKNGVEPIDQCFCVNVVDASFSSLRDEVARIVQLDPFFELMACKNDLIRIKHIMGWAFHLSDGGNNSRGQTLATLIRKLDPLASEIPDWLCSDLHSHTYWSDGLASPKTMTQTTKDLGLDYIAITDHSRSLRIQNGLSASAWMNQAVSLTHTEFSSGILHGMEVDISSTGKLDMPVSVLKAMDLVIASVHTPWKKDKRINTARLIRAIETGLVDVLGHPTTMLLGKPGIPSYERKSPPIDWDKVFEHCAKWHVAIEINCFPSRLDVRGKLLERAIQAGCWLSIGSDAHSPHHISALKFSKAILAEVSSLEYKLLNSLSLTEIKEWIYAARTHRQGLTKTYKEVSQGEFLFEAPKINDAAAIKVRISDTPMLPAGSSVVGIDLVSSLAKKSGVAYLSETNDVETCSLGVDDEIIAYINEKNPKFVSIDSPLGLPGGGEQIDPDAGIMRVAEYDLASVGISAYPALIDSMVKLTLRGVHLRKLIESLPSPPCVIESYPGAAQDILGIPRKQGGLHLLREGLERIGVSGSGLKTTSHDELDAITSAVVGRFFEIGQFQPMGIVSEAQLIVPVAPSLTFENRLVICMAGNSGAGKSVVSRYLSLFYGFEWIKTRDLIKQLLLEDYDGISTRLFGKGGFDESKIGNRHLGKFGKVILEDYGQVPVRNKLMKTVLSSKRPVVVDAVRSIEDFDSSLLNRALSLVWLVDCPERLIEKRCAGKLDRNSKTKEITKSIDSHTDEMRQSSSDILDNGGSLEKLRQRVDDSLFKYLEVMR